ncbi:phage portal protein [Devosia sp. 2618]|uniref:phage portal protein n=1 Tax=Devosia sp. 2618 TaxID=3156454 RepID=UPI003395451E
MQILGLNITRTKAAGNLARPDDRGGWWPIIKESYIGAWQRDVEVKHESVLSFHAAFACQTLIASDIAKLRVKLVEVDANGIWTETKNPAYSPVLRKPNRFQTRIQFFENWVLSKLQRGNAYILKERDGRGVVVRLYVLDPTRVEPLVAEDGAVYYELLDDRLVGLSERVIVPAREIIHDRFNCFFHPLVGLSPIFANGLSAMQGLSIQNNSASFFANGSQPGGILTAPGAIDQATADRLKAHWDSNYTGKNRGKVAVLGDGLKFEAMAAKATESQMIEQLKWSAEVVCSTYHVPGYMAGVGQAPAYNNIEALNAQYYTQCLQILMESIELCLDEGLGTGETLGTEFDLDQLLKMDSATMMEVLDKSSGKMTPNEQRKKIGLKPVAGGNSPMLQQQNFSLEALAKRDALADPFEKVPSSGTSPAVPPANDNADAEASKAIIEMMKGLA